MTSILTLLIGLLLTASELVTGLSVVPNLNRTEILVSVDGSVSFRTFSLAAPARIVVDLLNAGTRSPRKTFWISIAAAFYRSAPANTRKILSGLW